jgi:hypothetical protein
VEPDADVVQRTGTGTQIVDGPAPLTWLVRACGSCPAVAVITV